MYKYLIEGGHPLRGRIRPSGNKNSALPCLAATLLTDQPVVLRNVPEIEDVQVMMEILRLLGCRVEKAGDHAWRLQTLNIGQCAVPAELAQQIRASLLLAGPLLARCGKATLPPPGGDVIGRRRLDTHFLALKALGAQVEIDGQISLAANKLAGADLFLDEASVTATENAIMAAALAEGSTVIQNAASEPHVQDLCAMLNPQYRSLSSQAVSLQCGDGVLLSLRSCRLHRVRPPDEPGLGLSLARSVCHHRSKPNLLHPSSKDCRTCDRSLP
jgi:UDP-N-acetylglucosamine 1-carboxyvinyltransferase